VAIELSVVSDVFLVTWYLDASIL